jgi:hypothetical protein
MSSPPHHPENGGWSCKSIICDRKEWLRSILNGSQRQVCYLCLVLYCIVLFCLCLVLSRLFLCLYSVLSCLCSALSFLCSALSFLCSALSCLGLYLFVPSFCLLVCQILMLSHSALRWHLIRSFCRQHCTLRSRWSDVGLHQPPFEARYISFGERVASSSDHIIPARHHCKQLKVWRLCSTRTPLWNLAWRCTKCFVIQGWGIHPVVTFRIIQLFPILASTVLTYIWFESTWVNRVYLAAWKSRYFEPHLFRSTQISIPLPLVYIFQYPLKPVIAHAYGGRPPPPPPRPRHNQRVTKKK